MMIVRARDGTATVVAVWSVSAVTWAPGRFRIGWPRHFIVQLNGLSSHRPPGCAHTDTDRAGIAPTTGSGRPAAFSPPAGTRPGG